MFDTELNPSSDISLSRSSSPELPPLPSPTTIKGGGITIFKYKKTFFTSPAKEIDLTKLPRLENSQWNNQKAMNSLKKPAVNTAVNYTLDFSNFRSNPFTSSVFTAGQLIKKRNLWLKLGRYHPWPPPLRNIVTQKQLKSVRQAENQKNHTIHKK